MGLWREDVQKTKKTKNKQIKTRIKGVCVCVCCIGGNRGTHSTQVSEVGDVRGSIARL